MSARGPDGEKKLVRKINTSFCNNLTRFKPYAHSTIQHFIKIDPEVGNVSRVYT